ncbi:DUF2147 domain-containing protein [Hansschlegelia sp.]|uniref:DUF2147 domain-containing protein n=1 Tax=Hansschlegelia sp. TaxID=2041892 RepID=UPI002C22CF14|nr:DUF2147 domain-containing protein [Hansschlegelia sp.]HVI28167.1 DUF2147 domain-containing protein [Hansschlegelia sp.]
MMRGILAAAGLLVAASAAAASPAPVGVWSMPKDKATVRISECGEALCATLVGLKKPNDKNGRPKVDKRNPDRALRDRPVIGISLLTDMKPDGAGWAGRFYNPDDGRSYQGTIVADGNDRLKLRGCVVGGLLCKTQVLKRVD